MLSGAAVLRLKGSAAGFVMRCLVFCQERIGASDTVFFVPHLSAKSGCFDEYFNVFAVFSFGFGWFLF